MKYSLNTKDVASIEKALNKPGRTEVTLKVEGGKLVVLLVEKTKMN